MTPPPLWMFSKLRILKVVLAALEYCLAKIRLGVIKHLRKDYVRGGKP